MAGARASAMAAACAARVAVARAARRVASLRYGALLPRSYTEGLRRCMNPAYMPWVITEKGNGDKGFYGHVTCFVGRRADRSFRKGFLHA
jgi:hypothetical protein